MSNIYDTIFITIPININYDELGLVSNEEKQMFVDNFIKDVVHLPLIQTRVLESGETEEFVMGFISGGRQSTDYNINLIAMSLANIGTNFIKISTSKENNSIAIGKQLKISDISLSFEPKANETFFDITQKQRDIAEMIKDKIVRTQKDEQK